MQVGIATDHGGFDLKEDVVVNLRAAGHLGRRLFINTIRTLSIDAVQRLTPSRRRPSS
jgi:hypothetical protein